MDLLGNSGGIFFVTRFTHQLRVFLDHHSRSLFGNSSARRDLLTCLNDLRWKARDAAQAAIPKVSRAQPQYFHTLGALLREGQWGLDYPIRSLPDLHAKEDRARKTKVLVPLVEAYSDACVHELTGSSSFSVPPCNISDYCWDLMTSPGYVGYALTHQAFYLEIGEMSGCGHEMARLSWINGQGNISHLQDVFCSQVLSEAVVTETQGYPDRKQDLLMEQIVLCGVLGYREFLNEDWLRAILSWQDASGCFTRPEFQKNQGNRVKREDKKLQGSCSSHKTSVALGSLVASARFLLQMFTDGASFL